MQKNPLVYRERLHSPPTAMGAFLERRRGSEVGQGGQALAEGSGPGAEVRDEECEPAGGLTAAVAVAEFFPVGLSRGPLQERGEDEARAVGCGEGPPTGV